MIRLKGFKFHQIPILLAITVGICPTLFAANMDPLDNEELNQVLQITQPVSVQSSNLQTSGALSSSFQNEETNTQYSPQETLLIERHHNNKNETARLADVYVYHYSTDELEHTLVNLDTQEVISKNLSQGTQLPLTASELNRAKFLLQDNSAQFSLISAEYKQIIGQPLDNIGQLNIKAFIFHADSLPQQVNQASSQCGIHRCAQILLYTHDNIVFEISPIIDLSANEIIQNTGF